MYFTDFIKAYYKRSVFRQNIHMGSSGTRFYSQLFRVNISRGIFFINSHTHNIALKPIY